MAATSDPDLDAARFVGLAREVSERQADLVSSVERWATCLASDIDDIVARLGTVEDVVGVGVDEVGRRRAQRALIDALLDLADVSATLRLGPPATAGYRLDALARALFEQHG